MGIVALPQNTEEKYLNMHLGRRPTWAKQIKTKIKQYTLKATQKQEQHYQQRANSQRDFVFIGIVCCTGTTFHCLGRFYAQQFPVEISAGFVRLLK
jgi:hypothetical protein